MGSPVVMSTNVMALTRRGIEQADLCNSPQHSSKWNYSKYGHAFQYIRTRKLVAALDDHSEISVICR